MTLSLHQSSNSGVLELFGITKRFGNLVANDHIDLSLAEGEVLALLGENGAGKTTLMNIVFGHYVADAGRIEVRNKPLIAGSSEAAINAGIGMVHQHFTLADNLTVLENITLGRESLWSLRQKTSASRRKLLQISDKFGIRVNPDAIVGKLTIGEKQRVEILKALYADAHILILDEPTAVLTPQEVDGLFSTLRKLVKQGRSAVLISHKLEEIIRVSDRIAVLRRGKLVGTLPTSSINRDQLAEMMVGHEVVRPQSEPLPAGDIVLKLDRVSTRGTKGQSLSDITLEVCQHEIVGVAGVAGNGQDVLADLVSGSCIPTAGEAQLLGHPIAQLNPRSAVDAGVGRIPEDRHRKGVIGEMTVWENLVSENLRKPPFVRYKYVLNQKAARNYARTLIEQFDIRCSGPMAETRLLSGGNMQKLILARGLSRNPEFIVANQPSRGLDEGAIAYVHHQLLEARRLGAGILLISEDLDELLTLSDRIVVMFQGQLQHAPAIADLNITSIGLMMSGQKIA